MTEGGEEGMSCAKPVSLISGRCGESVVGLTRYLPLEEVLLWLGVGDEPKNGVILFVGGSVGEIGSFRPPEASTKSR